MSLSLAARPVLRSSAFRALPARSLIARRLESTAVDKVAATAKATAQKAADTARATQGRIGRLIAAVEKQVPWLIYYSRVSLELSKLVMQGQKMYPPSVSTFQSYYQGAWKALQHPAALLQSTVQQPAILLQQVRSLSPAQLVTGGVIFAECLGFFTVGEMLGRLKLVGYHGEAHGAHH